MQREIISGSAAETEQAGADLVRALSADKAGELWFVCLYGDLGAGKTAFVRGFAGELSPGSRVKSPTYTVVNEYRGGRVPVYHFDLYRLEDSEDALDGIGFDDYVADGHCILEWSEFLPEVPENAVHVRIEKLGEDSRRVVWEY